MPLDHRPESPEIGEVGRAFVHEDRCAITQWTIDHITVPGDPADVGRTPVDILVVQVEDILGRQMRADEIAAGGVDNALGFAGGSAGIENEQRVFAVHGFRRAFRGLVLDRIIPPDIPTGLHHDIVACPFEDNHLLDQGCLGQCFIDVGLQRNHLPTAESAVGRNDVMGLSILHPVQNRLAGETAEDDAVRSPDQRARQHRHNRFGHHGHVDRDAVALADALLAKAIGKLRHHLAKLAVGDAPHLAAAVVALARLAFPEERDLVTASKFDLAVHAVDGRVGLAADEPLGKGWLPFQHLIPSLRPIQFGGSLAPEAFGVGHGFLIEALILLHGSNVGFLRELRRRGEDSGFNHDRLDRGSAVGHREAPSIRWYRSL